MQDRNYAIFFDFEEFYTFCFKLILSLKIASYVFKN